MIKFSLYRQKSFPKDRLICNKINYKGEITVLRDVHEFNDIVIRFLKEEYRIMIKGDSLYLFNRSTIFELLRFPEIINCNHLVRMKQNILTKMSEEDLIPEQIEDDTDMSHNVKFGEVRSFIDGILVKNNNGIKVLPMAVALFALFFSSFWGQTEDDSLDNTDNTIDSSHIEEFFENYNPAIIPLSYGMIMGEEYFKNIDSTGLNSLVDDVQEEIEEIVEENLFEEKSLVVRQRDFLTREMLDKLLICMCDGSMPGVSFASSDEALNYLYENEERTYLEKMLIVMIREGISYEELDDICAGVVAEAGEYYDECYRVASVGYNRYKSINFVNYFGPGLYTQFLAKSQFSVFFGEKTYLDFKGCIDLIGYQAALDMFYSRVVNTDYLSFRGWWKEVPSNWESFMYHGNQFGDHQPASDVYKLEYEYVIEEELAEDMKNLQNGDMILERNLENLN